MLVIATADLQISLDKRFHVRAHYVQLCYDLEHHSVYVKVEAIGFLCVGSDIMT